MIDIHCHILPGIDDGPQEISESLSMLKMAELDGITDIIATPHLSAVYSYNIDKINDSLRSLRARVIEENININLHYGLEVQMSEDIFKRHKNNLRELTINNEGKYMLLEMPFMDYPLYINDIIDIVISNDIIPIIVHPLRNARILTNTNILRDLKKRGVVFQFNKNAIMNGYQIKTSTLFYQLLKRGLVDIVASDAHSIDNRRPTLKKSYKKVAKRAGASVAETLFVQNPQRVIKGEMTEEIVLKSNEFVDKIKNIFNF